MPIFNTRLEGEARDQQGKVTPIPPRVVLQQAGPVIQVILSPLEVHLKVITERGGELPPSLSGRALIDTGATMTCVDADAARRAGLAQVDSGTMTSATHANEKVPIFAGRLIMDAASITVNANRAIGANLSPQGLIALIGRDLLAQCVLVYNGLDGSFSLSI